MSVAVAVGVGAGAVAAEPTTEITLSVTPTSFVGDEVKVKALVTHLGVPVSTGSVQFSVNPGDSPDYGPTVVSGPVVDGVATGTFQGGLVSGDRTMIATYVPTWGSGVPQGSTTVPFHVAKRATSTTVSLAPHPVAGQWIATPAISHAGGAITQGECTTYVDGVRVGTSTCSGQVITAAAGTHTVTVDYLPDPFGIPSDRVLYAPSTGSTTLTVPAPPVVTPPVVTPPVTPAGPVATVARVVTAKKSLAKKKRSFTITIAAADGSALSGTVFLVLNGPQKLTQKLTFTSGRAVASVVLKKAGSYTAVAKVSSAPTHEGTKSPAVRFKVVAPKR